MLIIECSVSLPMRQSFAEGAPGLALVTQRLFQSCKCTCNLKWRLRMTSLGAEDRDSHRLFEIEYNVVSDACIAA
jgi:hypothetical protein